MFDYIYNIVIFFRNRRKKWKKGGENSGEKIKKFLF